MAIDKKLIHFKTWDKFISPNGVNGNWETPNPGTYEDDGTAVYGQIKGTSIVFIKDVGKIWTHGKLYAEGTGGGGASITVDSELSETSTNPVQNKVVKSYVDNAIANAIINTLNTEV